MFLLIVQIVEHKADLLMFVLIVLEFWSLSQGHRLTGDIKCVQVLNKKVWLEKKIPGTRFIFVQEKYIIFLIERRSI